MYPNQVILRQSDELVRRIYFLSHAYRLDKEAIQMIPQIPSLHSSHLVLRVHIEAGEHEVFERLRECLRRYLLLPCGRVVDDSHTSSRLGDVSSTHSQQ